MKALFAALDRWLYGPPLVRSYTKWTRPEDRLRMLIAEDQLKGVPCNGHQGWGGDSYGRVARRDQFHAFWAKRYDSALDALAVTYA